MMTATQLALSVPALFAPTPAAGERFVDFFTSNIRNRNTRRAYRHAVAGFAGFCEARGVASLREVRPIHVAAYIEQLGLSHSKPTAKLHLAAVRMLFDWLVTGQIIQTNPAHAVRGPRHSVKKGKTPVLTAEETRQLLDSINISSIIGLRDRALIGLMVYTFARVGAAVEMKVKDVFVQGRRYWVRLHEKGGKEHTIPCHHNLQEFLLDYIEGARPSEPNSPLFVSASGRNMDQSAVYYMIARRARAAGIETRVCCHTFRATGITAYLKNGGRLEIAQQMANHESSRTTGLYDRRSDDISLDEVERIVI